MCNEVIPVAHSCPEFLVSQESLSLYAFLPRVALDRHIVIFAENDVYADEHSLGLQK